jgi:hypothetical protein
LQLDRTPSFTGPLNIELIEPPPGKGVTATPTVIDSGQSETSISIVFESGVPRESSLVLKFRATGQLTDGVTVVSETTVPVQFE